MAQPFDMDLFLKRQVDAASAMTYNELAQVLEVKNPETGKLYTLDDLNVLKMPTSARAMLEDGIFVREDWIADEANQDIADAVPQGDVQGLDLLPRPPRRLRRHRARRTGPSSAEGHQTLADERDQRRSSGRTARRSAS